MTKTFILFAAIAAVATPALAQDVTREDIRQDRKQVQHDEKKLDSAQKYGSDREVARRAANLADSQAQLHADHQVYRAGVYARPAGWTERVWVAGDRLPASYYARTYWVDPARYDLTVAPEGEHWVRVDHDVVRIGADGTVREIRKGWFY